MYPRDFRVKLFISDLRMDLLFGTLDEKGFLFLSAHDVGCILRKKDPYTWGDDAKSCRYQDIGKDSRKAHYPLMERKKVLMFLKPFRQDQVEARFLYSLLTGCEYVRYDRMQATEHVLTCCPCDFEGMMFKTWLRDHRIRLFCKEPMTLTPLRRKWDFYNVDVKCTPDFRIRLHQTDFLFGTISQKGVVYYSTYHIAMCLRKGNEATQWSDDITTCYYRDIGFGQVEKRKKFKMIREDILMTLLKEEKNSSDELKYLQDLLQGKKNVKYDIFLRQEHNLNCCNCAQFYGIAFDDWLWIHKTHVFQHLR